MYSKDAGNRRFLPAVKGFTLLELMIVLAIGAVLLSIAVPSFSSILQNAQRTAAVNELVAALNYSRAQAVTTRSAVTMCRSVNGDSCATGSGGWQSGWIVFADDDANGLRAGDEAILRLHEALHGGISLNGNTNLQRRVTFRAVGNTGNNGRMVFCDARGWTDEARVIIVATTGRIRALSKAEDPNEPLPGCTP